MLAEVCVYVMLVAAGERSWLISTLSYTDVFYSSCCAPRSKRRHKKKKTEMFEANEVGWNTSDRAAESLGDEGNQMWRESQMLCLSSLCVLTQLLSCLQTNDEWRTRLESQLLWQCLSSFYHSKYWSKSKYSYKSYMLTATLEDIFRSCIYM